MSPEQVRGKSVDKRADIWAFGCVFYEMLSGSRAFDAESITEVLAAVLTEEPDWSNLPQTTPPAIQRLLRRCLVKEPKQRLRDIGDARIAIEEVQAGAGGAGVPQVAAQSSAAQQAAAQQRQASWRRAAPWALVGRRNCTRRLGRLDWRRPKKTGDVVRFSVHRPSVRVSESSGSQLSLSPDGRKLAFVIGVPERPIRYCGYVHSIRCPQNPFRARGRLFALLVAG